jgi:hypothetical protein
MKRKKVNSITKNIIFLYILVYSILSILKFFNVVNDLFLISSIYAGILNLANTYAAVKLFNFSYRSGNTSFMIYSLGGLGIRLMVLLLIFVLVIKFLNIDYYGFILVFFLFYFISLIFEIIFYLKKAKKIA